MLTTLFRIMHKGGEKELEPYETFLQRVQGVVDELVIDPHAVELDAFAKQLEFKPPDLRAIARPEWVSED